MKFFDIIFIHVLQCDHINLHIVSTKTILTHFLGGTLKYVLSCSLMKLKFIIAHSLCVHALHQHSSWNNLIFLFVMMALVGVIKKSIKSTKGKKKVIQTIQHVKKTKGIQKYLKKQNVDYWLWVIPLNKNLHGYALHYFNITNNQMKMRLA